MTKTSKKTTTRRKAKTPGNRTPSARRLNAALRAGNADRFVDVLGDAVQKHGPARIAKKAGISHTELSSAFSAEGKSEVAAFIELVGALGFKLRLKSASA